MQAHVRMIRVNKREEGGEVTCILVTAGVGPTTLHHPYQPGPVGLSREAAESRVAAEGREAAGSCEAAEGRSAAGSREAAGSCEAAGGSGGLRSGEGPRGGVEACGLPTVARQTPSSAHVIYS